MPPKRHGLRSPRRCPRGPRDARGLRKRVGRARAAIGHSPRALRDIAAGRISPLRGASSPPSSTARSRSLPRSTPPLQRPRQGGADRRAPPAPRLDAELDALGGESERRMETLAADGLRARAEAKAEIDARLAEIAEPTTSTSPARRWRRSWRREALREATRRTPPSRELERDAAAEKDEMHRDLEAKIASTKANMKATTDAQLTPRPSHHTRERTDGKRTGLPGARDGTHARQERRVGG